VLSLYRALERVDVAMPSYLGGGPALTGIASGPGMLAPPREGTTAIWEAIALTSVRVLAPRSAGTAENQRRRAIILLTDGFDTSSRLKRSEALASAIAAEAVIYAIGIGDGKYSGVDKDALEAVAESTGGRAFFPKKDVDLKKAFGEIEQELRSQYLIAYSSSNKRRDGSFRQIRLEITNPVLQKENLKLRYRPGYFARPLQSGN
jgi:VWFA-related protein